MRTTAKDGRGSEAELADLHGLMAKYFAARLHSGESLAPSELNVIRQFLKDNSIDCVGHENPVLFDITKNLPAFDLEEDDTKVNYDAEQEGGEKVALLH